MTTPVANIPKDLLIGEVLKDEILKEHNLKPTEATEKNILPSAEDVKQEKTHQNMLSGEDNHVFPKLQIEAFLREIFFVGEMNKIKDTKAAVRFFLLPLNSFRYWHEGKTKRGGG